MQGPGSELRTTRGLSPSFPPPMFAFLSWACCRQYFIICITYYGVKRVSNPFFVLLAGSPRTQLAQHPLLICFWWKTAWSRKLVFPLVAHHACAASFFVFLPWFTFRALLPVNSALALVCRSKWTYLGIPWKEISAGKTGRRKSCCRSERKRNEARIFFGAIDAEIKIQKAINFPFQRINLNF